MRFFNILLTECLVIMIYASFIASFFFNNYKKQKYSFLIKDWLCGALNKER